MRWVIGPRIREEGEVMRIQVMAIFARNILTMQKDSMALLAERKQNEDMMERE